MGDTSQSQDVLRFVGWRVATGALRGWPGGNTGAAGAQALSSMLHPEISSAHFPSEQPRFSPQWRGLLPFGESTHVLVRVVHSPWNGLSSSSQGCHTGVCHTGVILVTQGCRHHQQKRKEPVPWVLLSGRPTAAPGRVVGRAPGRESSHGRETGAARGEDGRTLRPCALTARLPTLRTATETPCAAGSRVGSSRRKRPQHFREGWVWPGANARTPPPARPLLPLEHTPCANVTFWEERTQPWRPDHE